MNEIGIQHSRVKLLLLVLIGVIATWGSSESWAQNTNDQIGFVIAANGTVTIASQNATPRPASLRQQVFPNDTITTGPDASAKVLFDDNTILNVMENSQVEITQYVYDPETAKRNTIFSLGQGQIKVLVPDYYAATGSRFEIHTPTTVAAALGTESAARGTEYVVFTSPVNGVTATTVAVTSGSVTVTAGDQSAIVAAGSFTTVDGGAAPASPAPTSAAPAVQNAVANAEVKTAPAVVGQVQIAMAQTTAQQAAAIAAVNSGVPVAAVAAPAAVPSVPSVPSGISQTMGTTTTPCTVVSASGNVPLGCIP